MSTDYRTSRSVRRLSQVGWGVTALMLLPVLLIICWKIAQAIEQRSMEATRENLDTGLNNLAAQRMADGRTLESAWRQANPFSVLRWRQDNYAGELVAGMQPKTGNWYWLPAKAWIVYRVRFGDVWTQPQYRVHAYRILAGPEQLPTGAALAGRVFTLEIEAVPAVELSAVDWLYQ